MRYILYSVVLLSSIYGCKRTSSESKGWGKLGKEAVKVGQLSDEMITTIKHAVRRANDTGEVDDLKKLISQGGKVADEAILAYRRSFADHTERWLTSMRDSHQRIVLLKEELPIGLKRVTDHSYELGQEIRLAEHYTAEFLDILEWRLRHVNELADGSSEIADKLCCNSINFSVLEKNLTPHSGKLADNFDKIRNILKAEEDFLADLRTKSSTTKQTDQTSKTVSPPTQQLSYDVQKLFSDASNDADFIAARLAIKNGLKDGKQAELRVVFDDLLANNPAKIDQFYQSFTNRRFADIEHAMSETMPKLTGNHELYRTLDELLEDTQKLHKDIIERGKIFKEIIDEDKLKIIQNNNRRYMVDNSKITKVPYTMRNKNQHWLNQLPQQVSNSGNSRLVGKERIKGVDRGQFRSKIVAIEKEVKAIKATCKDALC